MRAGWLATWVVLVVAGCQAIPTAADFDFPDGDGVVVTNDVGSGTDAVDAADLLDGADLLNVADSLAGSDVADIGDSGSEVEAGTDVVDAVDGVDVLDAADVAEAADGGGGQDAADTDVAADLCAGKNCTDNVPCTADKCVAGAGCVHTPDNTKCDDGQLCTADTCSGTGCQHVNTAAACDDGDACTIDSCVIGADCIHTPDNSKCDDGNVCTSDYCQSGSCTQSANALGCDDGSACTISDKCTGGNCVAVQNCDDGNACTNDSCVSLACQHLNNTAACNDGNGCTTGDVCSAGKCKGVGPACGNGTCECGETTASCGTDCTSTPPAGMVMIPAGTFWMGCNATKDSTCSGLAHESPQHKVTLSAYYMDLTEITVSQWQACVNASGCTVPSTQSPSTYATYPGFPNNPVNYITWTQAQQYCKWRGAEYDLPTEAQWEMAARGSCEKNGSTAGDAGCAAAMRTYPWGETAPSASYAVYSVSSTAAVGSKTAGDSPYGLHDMAGNVWELTRDWYSGTYYGNSPSNDPVNSASASARVRRGGSIDSNAANLRAGFRGTIGPSYAYEHLGLRCMRSYP